MADTIDIPQIGPVNKNKVLVIGGVGAGVVAYAWWRSRGTSAGADEAPAPAPVDPYDGTFGTNGGTGAVAGYPDRSSDTLTTAPRTNAEWSNLAKEKLADSYDPDVISGALGRYLTRKPLTSLDQTVVQAAIALAGYPPEGSYAVIPGGNTEMTVAPSGVRAAPAADRAVISWAPVAGAGGYLVSRTDQSSPTAVNNATSLTLNNLDPGRSYRVQVAAVANGKRGPWSSTVSFRTTIPALKAPTGLKVTQISNSAVRLSWNSVAGARGYRAFRTGLKEPISTSTGTTLQIGGLRPNTPYSISIRAETGAGETLGPPATIRIRTKK